MTCITCQTHNSGYEIKINCASQFSINSLFKDGVGKKPIKKNIKKHLGQLRITRQIHNLDHKTRITS